MEQPDRIIEGEQWTAPRADDARHWVSVYDELIALHRHLVTQAGGEGMAAERRPQIERSLDRLSRRREQWRCVRSFKLAAGATEKRGAPEVRPPPAR